MNIILSEVFIIITKFQNSNNDDKKFEESIIELIKEKHPKNTEQLISFLQEKNDFTKEEIINLLIGMENKGILNFRKETENPISLGAYFFTRHALWYWIVIGLSLATTISIFTIPGNSSVLLLNLRMAFSLIFILLLPGYSLVRTLFPLQIKNKNKLQIEKSERLGLSFGMSLVIVTLTGLLLNFTPFGITIIPLVLSLFLITLSFSTIGILREFQLKTN